MLFIFYMQVYAVLEKRQPEGLAPRVVPLMTFVPEA
jgi:hypothetical protein